MKNWFTMHGMLRQSSRINQFIFKYSVDSYFGRYINRVGGVHDWFNSWTYTNGNFVARGEAYNTAVQAYSMLGMPIAGVYTASAFSAASYQPVLR